MKSSADIDARAPPLIPGAIETVRRMAADVPVAVASSAHPEVIAAALEATGLAGVFRVVVSSDSVAHGKPAPDVYLEAARQLGMRSGRMPRHGGFAKRGAGGQEPPG